MQNISCKLKVQCLQILALCTAAQQVESECSVQQHYNARFLLYGVNAVILPYLLGVEKELTPLVSVFSNLNIGVMIVATFFIHCCLPVVPVLICAVYVLVL